MSLGFRGNVNEEFYSKTNKTLSIDTKKSSSGNKDKIIGILHSEISVVEKFNLNILCI